MSIDSCPDPTNQTINVDYETRTRWRLRIRELPSVITEMYRTRAYQGQPDTLQGFCAIKPPLNGQLLLLIIDNTQLPGIHVIPSLALDGRSLNTGWLFSPSLSKSLTCKNTFFKYLHMDFFPRSHPRPAGGFLFL